jgi:ABC-type lipoprotein release transport system permease subunit
MSGFALARRTAVRYPARTCLAVLGVAVIAALNFDMLLLSRGLLLSFADMLGGAGYDVRVMGGGGVPAIRFPIHDAAALADAIRRLPEVGDVARVRLDQVSAAGPSGPEQPVTLIGASLDAAHPIWTITAGRSLPVDEGGAPPSVVLGRSMAAALGAEPGMLVRLRAGDRDGRSLLPAITCRVVGVADFSLESARALTAAVSLDTFQAVQGGGASDEADLVLVASAPEAGPDAATAAIARLRPGLHVYSNAALVEQFNRNGFAYFRQMSLVLSTTTATFTCLLVAVLLTVSVNQRLGQIAALRAIGISRQHVAAMLLWESALLVGVGGAVALPIGGVLAHALDDILRRMPNLPERLHFFVFEPRAVVLHAALLAATAVVAAAYPIWLAVRLPIAPTLRREVVS